MSLTDLIPGVSQGKLVLAGAALAGVLGVVGVIGVQAALLHHANSQLDTARAALIDPGTKKTWQSEEQAAEANLTTCQGNFARADATVQADGQRILALQQQADAAKVAGKARQSAAEAASRTAAGDAARVMSERAGGDLCASALAVLREP